MTAAVSIRDLSFAYEKDPVISHMDLTFPAGTITAVLGPTAWENHAAAPAVGAV